MVSLCGGDQVEQTKEFLADQVFIVEGEVLYGAEGDGICADACVKQMDCIVGKQCGYHTTRAQWRGRGGSG